MAYKKEVDWSRVPAANLMDIFGTPMLVGLTGVWAADVLTHQERIIPWAMAAASLYALGTLADLSATLSGLPDLREAKKLGFKYHELHPDLPDIPTPKDFSNPRLIARTIGEGVVSIIIPPVGVFIGTGGFVAATNNMLVRKEMRRKIESRK